LTDARRPDPYVLARFLDALWGPPGSPPPKRSKSSLQRAARVNYEIFRRYLAYLERLQLVEVQPGERSDQVVLTPAGRETHARLQRWIADLLSEW